MIFMNLTNRFSYIYIDNGRPIDCCSSDLSNAPPRFLHPACAPLKVQSNGIACLNYVRSALGVSTDCKFGPAEQVKNIKKKIKLFNKHLYIEKPYTHAHAKYK